MHPSETNWLGVVVRVTARMVEYFCRYHGELMKQLISLTEFTWSIVVDQNILLTKMSGIFERSSINLKKHCILFSWLMKHPLYYSRWNYFWYYIKIKKSGLVLSADSYSFHYFLYIKAFYYFQFLSCIVEDISIFFTRRMQWKKLPSETTVFWWMYGTWCMIICSF